MLLIPDPTPPPLNTPATAAYQPHPRPPFLSLLLAWPTLPPPCEQMECEEVMKIINQRKPAEL